MLIGAPRPFYARQAFLCMPAHTLTFMLVRPFYAIQRTSCSESWLSLWKKNKIDLSRNDSFLDDGLSGLSFCSRQKDRCDLLDLPVLYSYVIPQGFGSRMCTLTIPIMYNRHRDESGGKNQAVA